MPRELTSGSRWAPPRVDLSLGETRPDGAMSVSSVKTFILACAAAAKGDTSLAFGCTACLDVLGDAAASVPDVVAAAAAAGGSAGSCMAFLLEPPNLLLGGAEVNNSPPGMLGKPAKELLGALLDALSGQLSVLGGGGGARWGSGSGRGSGSLAVAANWRLLYE